VAIFIISRRTNQVKVFFIERRKKIGDNKKRATYTKVVRVRLTESEFKAVQAVAKERGTNVSKEMRDSVLVFAKIMKPELFKE
jgi:hypothetical protein